ncbi:hypothetical protein GCM10010912_68240 [Paenibacillus albidus]|uniref:Uncharacterized protein n=1 Tax=Paenibacillus albidus TaxID=2041023 RepID=A0A917LCV0_9BACL|nr:hypothetical protein GCM10010912_68240 [Paenibacillus albidus]
MRVKCDCCGTEQFIKDFKFDKYYREDFEKAKMVLCDRNVCAKSQIKMPKGYIRQIFWLGG